MLVLVVWLVRVSGYDVSLVIVSTVTAPNFLGCCYVSATVLMVG